MGCGGDCKCTCDAQAGTEKKLECDMLDMQMLVIKNGKCPCGKALDDCCHRDIIAKK